MDDKHVTPINMPSHYQHHPHGWDLLTYFRLGLITEDELRGFYKGNIFKYLDRYQFKNGKEDLDKARNYLDELIVFELSKDSNETDESDVEWLF